MGVMVFDFFYYSDVDFAMQTDAPHWSDHPLLNVLYMIVMLPLLMAIMVVVAGAGLLSLFNVA